MVAHVSRSLPLHRPLPEVVAALTLLIPPEAHSVCVHVVIANLIAVGWGRLDGTNYQVCFEQPTPMHEAGDVYLTWGEGNLESFSKDNVLETL